MTEPSAPELAEAGIRHAEGLTAKLSLPDWRPGRSHIEQARNSIQKLAVALRAAPPAQEPVAWDVAADRIITDPFVIHLRECSFQSAAKFESTLRSAILRALAALPSSPAPVHAPHKEGVDISLSDIFQECAEIALACVGQEDLGHNAAWSGGYDKACRDIAEAIKLRASNRKTMDALATKDSR